MKKILMVSRWTRLLLLASLLTCMAELRAATIFQAANSPAISFEAETYASLINAAPTAWLLTNDATASGSKALYQTGDNQTGSSSSFALYALKFSQPGTYSLYYRWRADKTRTDQDQNGANSFRVPVDFGDLPNDSSSSNFVTSTVNNAVQVPAANSFNVFKDGQTYTVTQAQVDAGQALIFKVGTREWGMFIDRFVLSTSDALTEAEFNGLPNSETDLIVQGSTDTFVAFEAERNTELINAAPTAWLLTNDATASGSKALYQAGDNQTGSSSSFALYALKFSQPGAYSLYYRWRADKTRTDQDQNGANSFRVPVDFGDLPNDSSSSNFVTSTVNNAVQVPAANSFNVFKDGQTYTVTQAQVDAGQALIFKVGTREWGMFIDRFVLSTSDALTEAEVNALPNSGSSTRPMVLKATGSASLVNITVSFDKPLAAASASPANFTVSGGLTVQGAVLNTSTAKDIILATTAQTAGNNYTVTIKGGVTDVSGNAIVPNSKVSFTAWKLSAGWASREFYFNLQGGTDGTVADLTGDPNYPDNPGLTDVSKGFLVNAFPAGNNFGARLRAYFTPPASGSYDFFIYNDGDADVYLSTDQSPNNLQYILAAPAGSTNFESAATVTSPFTLSAGQKYLVEVQYAHNTGSALLGVGARRVGDTTPLSGLPILGGNQISTFINPDLGAINFVRQPSGATNAAGTRATFAVTAASTGGTLYYQWQVNGADISGANRATYVTPVLKADDNGKEYKVVVSVAGNAVSSNPAQLTVVSGGPVLVQPYLGVNFVGGGAGGVLNAKDVAGVVQQENFNNLSGNTASAAPLVDSAGAATPVTLTFDPVATSFTGAGDFSGDRELLQGYIHNSDTNLLVTLNGIPAGTYNLILYSVGFNFNTTYEQSIDVTGDIPYPTHYLTAQHAGQYLADPKFIRVSSTDPASLPLGNYVQFDNISPASDGSLAINITPLSTNLGINYLPALNGLQLTKPIAAPAQPVLMASYNAASRVLTISWDASASGFTLESASNLGPGVSWNAVSGVAKPLNGAGSTTLNLTADSQKFIRLRK